MLALKLNHVSKRGHRKKLHVVCSMAAISFRPKYDKYIDGLVQERRNSSALIMELRLSCTKPSIWRVLCVTNEIT